MPRKPALKVVAPDAGPPARVDAGASILGAAKSGSRLDLLVALRDRIAADIEAGVPARDLASLSKRLMDIATEIEALLADGEGDDVGKAAATPDEAW